MGFSFPEKKNFQIDILNHPSFVRSSFIIFKKFEKEKMFLSRMLTKFLSLLHSQLSRMLCEKIITQPRIIVTSSTIDISVLGCKCVMASCSMYNLLFKALYDPIQRRCCNMLFKRGGRGFCSLFYVNDCIFFFLFTHCGRQCNKSSSTCSVLRGNDTVNWL